MNSSETFEQKVKSEQRDNGQWNTDVADLVPSAISNLFQCSIERFSSGDIPYLKIDLELSAAESSNLKHTGNIQLAYSARQGNEHYDSCIDRTPDNNDDVTGDESTVETENHSGCSEDKSSDIIILGGENVKDMQGCV